VRKSPVNFPQMKGKKNQSFYLEQDQYNMYGGDKQATFTRTSGFASISREKRD